MFKGKIGALRVDLGMNSAQFLKGSDQALTGMKRMQRKMSAIGSNMRGIGAKLSFGATLPLVAFAKTSMSAAATQEKAVAAMETALTSMGNTAGFTSDQLQSMASDLQNTSLFGDEDILQKVTANLLTFGNVSGEAFSRAQQAAVDLSARLGQDLQSSTVMLGKALNDPVKGITALSRVGVAFTEQQKNQIKAMAEAGDVAGAQALILDELNKQYSGQAEALRDLPAGQIQAASMAIGDAMEKIGSIMLPVVADVAKWVEALAVKFQNLSPETQKFVVIGGALAAALGPVAIAAGVVVAGLGALISPIGLVVVGVGALVGAGTYLVTHWDELTLRFPIIQQGIYGAKVAFEAFTPIIDFFGQVFSQAIDGARLAFDALTPVIDFFSEQFGIAVDLVSSLMSGDWAAAWACGNDLLSNAIDGYVNLLMGLGTTALEVIQNIGVIIGDEMALLGEKMKGWAGDVISGFVDGFKDKISSAKAAVTDFGDGVSGWFKDTLGIHSPSRVFKGYGVNIVEGLEIGINDAAPLATSAMEGLADDLKDVADKGFDGLWDGFTNSLAKGDISGVFKGAFSDLQDMGTESFSKVLKTAFDGGGLSSITGSISSAWSGVTGAISGINFGSVGSIFSGVGSAISSALPIIGAVSAIANLVSSFSSKTLKASGFDFSIDGGDLSGGTFETWKKTSFWGLFSKTSTSLTAFDEETYEALSGQAEAVRDAVADAYQMAGEAVEEGFIDGFAYDFGKIDTKGKTEEEIAELLSDAFTGYGDAISQAIGGVSYEVAAIFAQAKSILEPSGQSFIGVFADMADAANEVADLFGGVDALGSSVSGFIATYFSASEQFQMISDQVFGVFDDLGVSMPDTLKGFRELVLSQDLMSESGREAYAALMGVSDAFASINSGLDQSFDASGGWYASEYETRLAQVADTRGFSISTQVAQSAGTTQYGRTSIAADDGASVQVLQRILSVFEDWDENGYPQERGY